MLQLWREILAERRACVANVFPSTGEKLGHLLGGYEDLHPASAPKKRISAQGAVCLARVQWYDHEYTGLFRRADYCLLRMSSAMPTKLDRPSAPIMPYAPGTLKEAVLVPFVALKIFRSNFGSGNLIFGGRKTGQPETDFFAHCVCSHLTEKCSVALWPVLRAFRKHSRYPAQTGLSDAAAVGQDGVRVPRPRFPWALLLRPGNAAGAIASRASKVGDVEANFLMQLAALPPGTTVYHIFACPAPSAAKTGPLQHVGDLFSASRFVESALEARLRFRHQLKEEDYLVETSWEASLTKEHANFGWEHFERQQGVPPGGPLPRSNWVIGDEDEAGGGAAA